jgi:hypothetical protein
VELEMGGRNVRGFKIVGRNTLSSKWIQIIILKNERVFKSEYLHRKCSRE